jgi:peptidyl-prolyl cis-trans isomerase D
MFHWVHNNKRMIQIILIVISIPFALWGIDSYQRMFSGADDAASVDGVPISMEEFSRTFQSQLDSIRQVLGANFNTTAWDTPKQRELVLDSLINQKLVLQYGRHSNLAVDDESLRRAIAGMEMFQEGGKFSNSRYQALLRAQGYTEVGFEETLRQDLMAQRLSTAVTDTSIVSKALTANSLVLAGEQRRVAKAGFPATDFAGQVKLAPNAVETYYKENQKEFEVPEMIRGEYVVLSQEGLAAQEAVTPEDVRAQYDQKYAANEAKKEAARKKAEAILAEVRRDPQQFGEIAKRDSEDKGSAVNGGDVGFFGRGAMVKPFEDAAFKLKVGEISGIVESNFGFHIIKLTDTRKGDSGEERRASHILIASPEDAKTFDEAKGEIETALKRQKAQADYAKMVDDVQSLADQQNESLAPFIEKFKLPVQTSGWFTRQAGPASGILGSPKVLQALFSADSIKTHRATEAIETTHGTVVVARVLEYRAAEEKPLDAVRAETEKKLEQREALRLAREAGVAALADLNKGGQKTLSWSSDTTLSRDKPGDMAPDAVSAVFKANTAHLPAYVGVDDAQGYSVYRVSEVTPGAQPSADQVNSSTDAVRRTEGQQELRAFVSTLRDRTKVEINAANVDKSTTQQQ